MARNMYTIHSVTLVIVIFATSVSFDETYSYFGYKVHQCLSYYRKNIEIKTNGYLILIKTFFFFFFKEAYFQ